MSEKARSRNYPAFGLKEAIERARHLYSVDGKATVGADVAVQAWGYKGINGASLRTLGAMRQYGLLDAPGTKQVKLSHRALTIILEPDGSDERAAAIRDAAGAPAMFKEIRDQYPDGVPSDPAVVSWLVRSHNFGEDAAKDLIASYRDTMALVAGLGGNDIEQSQGVEPRHREPNNAPAPRQSSGGNMSGMVKTYSYVLPGNTVATVTLQGAVPGQEAVKLLEGFLDLVKKSIMAEAQPRETTLRDIVGGRPADN